MRTTSASPERKTAGLLAGGLALLSLGQVMSLWLPINKNLWTSSYAVFMAGWAMVLLAGFYWLIDVRGWRRWAEPFAWYGMNALALFVLSGLTAKLLGLIQWAGPEGAAKVSLKGWIYAHCFTPVASPINASLLFAVAFVLVFLAVARVMARRKWFLKI